MSIQISGGWLEGHLIRRARKDYRCDCWRGLSNGGKCKRPIPAGSFYAEGDPNDEAGGYGNDRICLECAGDDAKAAVPQ